jgi:hypothetical protein
MYNSKTSCQRMGGIDCYMDYQYSKYNVNYTLILFEIKIFSPICTRIWFCLCPFFSAQYLVEHDLINHRGRWTIISLSNQPIKKRRELPWVPCVEISTGSPTLFRLIPVVILLWDNCFWKLKLEGVKSLQMLY